MEKRCTSIECFVIWSPRCSLYAREVLFTVAGRFRMEKGKAEAQDFAPELHQPPRVGTGGGGVVGGGVLS